MGGEDDGTVSLDPAPARTILRGVTSLRYVDGGPTLRPSSTEEQEPAEPVLHCDACGDAIDGAPAGAGLFLWTRGDEIRYEEPPLCAGCAHAIAIGGSLQIDREDEE
jgi:hypothetical protein